MILFIVKIGRRLAACIVIAGRSKEKIVGGKSSRMVGMPSAGYQTSAEYLCARLMADDLRLLVGNVFRVR